MTIEIAAKNLRKSLRLKKGWSVDRFRQWIKQCLAWGDGRPDPAFPNRPHRNRVVFQSSHKYALRYFLPLFVLTLSACATTDPSSLSHLEAEVNKLVKNGMPIVEMKKTLSSNGFLCHEGTSLSPSQKDVIECTRNRGSLFPPYGCIQRILLEMSSATNTISNLKIEKPVCAGF